VITVGGLFVIGSAGWSEENLARQATYTLESAGYGYPGQIIPGSNVLIDKAGWYESPYVQYTDDGQRLIDGRTDAGGCVTTWFWGAMAKRVTLTFTLPAPAKVAQVKVCCPDSQGALTDGVELTLLRGSGDTPVFSASQDHPGTGGHTFEFEAGNVEARVARIVLQSERSPYMAISEVEIVGEWVGSLPAEVKPGLRRIVRRTDLAQATALPEAPNGAQLITTTRGVVPLSFVLREAPAAKPAQETNLLPVVRKLLDNNPATGWTSDSAQLTHRSAEMVLDLGRTWRIARLAVGLPGAKSGGYLNHVAASVAPRREGPWTGAVDRLMNPVWPPEQPAEPYYIPSEPLDISGRFLKVQFTQDAFSAGRMALADVLVWGTPGTDLLPAAKIDANPDRIPLEPEYLSDLRAPFRRIKEQKIAIAFGAADLEGLRKLKAAGIDAVLENIRPWGEGDPRKFEAVAEETARQCQEAGLLFFAASQFGSSHHYFQYRKLDLGNGVGHERTPCPLDRSYWRRIVYDPVMASVRASQRVPILGHAFDFEMYESDETNFSGACLCDFCFGNFAQEFLPPHAVDGVPHEGRQAFLKANDLSALYARYQAREVQKMASEIERAVHRINPDFVLGYLPIFEWVPGLSRGFGTPTQPVIVFSESEYTPGYSAQVDANAAAWPQAGYPVLYLPGLWLAQHKPESVAQNAFRLARAADGWWFFLTMAVTLPAEKRERYWTLAPGYDAPEYLAAMRRANDAIREYVRTGAVPDWLPESEEPPPPEATVPSTSAPPRIDGDLSDPPWQKAVRLAFRENARGGPPDAGSTAFVCYDDRNLYVAVECLEPQMEKVVATHTDPDDGDLWHDDCVEIFLSPRPATSIYYHFLINPLGVLADVAYGRQGVGSSETTWDSGATVAARRGPDHWTVELALPFRSVGGATPPRGRTWRANFNRERRPVSELSAWSPTGGFFHRPAHFGVLKWE